MARQYFKWLFAGVALFLGPQAMAGERVFDFSTDKVGEPPAGFTCARTGQGRLGVWQVLSDATAPQPSKVLAQSDADTTDNRFPLCVRDDALAADLELSVRFKAIAGKADQAAGLIWRYQDPNNYYVVRANALEGNVVLYKVEKGVRIDLAVKGKGKTYGAKAPVPKASWLTLRVTAAGSLFTVHFGGQKLYEVEDKTFTKPGKIGVWTKADSVIYFADLRLVSP